MSEELAESIADFVLAAEPFMASERSNAAPAIHIAVRLLQGVLVYDPTAVALYKRILTGEIPPMAEIQLLPHAE